MPKNSNTYPKPQCVQTDVSVSAFLNGKAKQDFEVFQIHRSLVITNADRLENYKISFKDLEPYSHHIWQMDKVYLNALLIEWFDSVGLFISIIPVIYQNERLNCFQVEINNKVIGQKIIHSRNFNSRTEAILRAIEFANVLYNEKVVQAEH